MITINNIVRGMTSTEQYKSNTNNNVGDKELEKKLAEYGVSLTDDAKDLAKLEKQTSGLSPLNTFLIEHVKQQIADGKYNANPEEIADKMISYESLLDRLKVLSLAPTGYE